jgi:histidyl-tRNA synthetase
LLVELGIADGVTLELNTLGDPETRDAWRGALVEYFQRHRGDLSEESVARLERNPLRILDSKDPKDRAICENAPAVDDHLTSEAGEFFASVIAGIQAAGVPWKRNSRLVRGLDYYRHTAFEFVTDRLGAQGTVIAGGRYDGLIEALGGPHTPAVGWAAGIERLAMMIDAPPRERPQVAVVAEDKQFEDKAWRTVSALRNGGVSAELFVTGSPRKRYDRALKSAPAMTVAYNIHNGVAGSSHRVFRPDHVDPAHVRAILDAVDFDFPVTVKS